MAKVSFYLLEQAGAPARLQVTCRLIEKAYLQGLTVYVQVDSETQAHTLDQQLWVFRDGSFIPHALYPTAKDELSKVWIGWQPPPPHWAQVLFNLSSQLANADERIIEVLDQRPELLATGRIRYRLYRERGDILETHRL